VKADILYPRSIYIKEKAKALKTDQETQEVKEILTGYTKIIPKKGSSHCCNKARKDKITSGFILVEMSPL